MMGAEIMIGTGCSSPTFSRPLVNLTQAELRPQQFRITGRNHVGPDQPPILELSEAHKITLKKLNSVTAI